MATSDRRSRKGYDKSATKRPKRGVNINDIEKLKSRSFKIIDLDNSSIDEKDLSDIPTKDDKSIQKHQITRTLHKNCDISVPDFKPIRYELPNKSLNPSLKSMNHKIFKLPNHYIQYVSCRDKGHVSFKDFYYLKKNDIEWLINQISNKSFSGYNLIENINKSLINNKKSIINNKIDNNNNNQTPTPFIMSLETQTSLPTSLFNNNNINKNITPPPNTSFTFNNINNNNKRDNNSMSPPINTINAINTSHLGNHKRHKKYEKKKKKEIINDNKEVEHYNKEVEHVQTLQTL
eukprot:416243_1